MDVRLLRYFHAVARLKSFSKAADALSISQPALSQGVKNLEKELHCSLFIRGKTLQVTDEGEKLFSHCEELFRVLENIVDDISNTKSPRKGTIRVGVLESVLLYWMPAILGDYFTKYPNVSAAFEKSETVAIESGVLDDKLHLGIISRPSFSRKLEDIELASFSHKLVVSSEFSEDLPGLAKHLPLFLLGNWQERALTSGTDLFARVPALRTLNPTNCAVLVRQIVANKLGMAVLPAYLAGPDLRVIEDYPLLKMGLYLIRRKNRRQNPLVNQFADFVCEWQARSALISSLD
ncbi:MAG TPA: LysR family transcriptional regulator [Candidatus Ozemobacteraceae bacterium]|nr:LysR family transcriptional regulator [Candidatus Ozemobacteraceae bacterium]